MESPPNIKFNNIRFEVLGGSYYVGNSPLRQRRIETFFQ